MKIQKNILTAKLFEMFTNRLKEVTFFDSLNKNKIQTLVNNIKNPPFLFGTAFNIEY